MCHGFYIFLPCTNFYKQSENGLIANVTEKNLDHGKNYKSRGFHNESTLLVPSSNELGWTVKSKNIENKFKNSENIDKSFQSLENFIA